MMGRVIAQLRIEANPHGDQHWIDWIQDGDVIRSTAHLTRAEADRIIDEVNNPKPVILQVPEPPGGGVWVDEDGKPLRWIPTIRLDG